MFMKKNLLFSSLLFIFLLQFSSCVSKKDIVYFQKGEIDQAKVSNSYKTIVKPDDLLLITVTAQDLEAVIPFNIVSLAAGTGGQQGYLVDSKGEIDFPILGKLKVGGLSRPELIALLEGRLSPDYLRKPTININIANYKVSVLGAVGAPGSYTIPNERLTILEALSLAGDLALNGKRDNILVIREENNRKNKYTIDLTSNAVFTSPVYYLQQNDVVYVEQNYASMQGASANANTNFFIGLMGTAVLVLTFLTR
jgi:polysaccharide export outer membrane protein